MVRLSVWLSAEQKSWVEEQAEEHDLKQAEVIRELVDAARFGESPLDSPTESFSDSVSESRIESIVESIVESEVESIRESVEELRVRIDELEELRAESGEKVGFDNVPPGVQGGETGSQNRGREINDIVTSWTPGTPGEDREARRDALRKALDLLRTSGSAQRSDFSDELYPESALESQQTETGWWEGMIRDGLEHAADHDLVELRGRTWYWQGDARDE